jgi:hypothetical protein
MNPGNASHHMVDDVTVILPYFERLVYFSLPAELSVRVLCTDAQLLRLQALALYMPVPVHLASSAIRLRDVTLILGSPFSALNSPFLAAVLNPVQVRLA